jgi:hypothetical protein
MRIVENYDADMEGPVVGAISATPVERSLLTMLETFF